MCKKTANIWKLGADPAPLGAFSTAARRWPPLPGRGGIREVFDSDEQLEEPAPWGEEGSGP